MTIIGRVRGGRHLTVVSGVARVIGLHLVQLVETNGGSVFVCLCVCDCLSVCLSVHASVYVRV